MQNDALLTADPMLLDAASQMGFRKAHPLDFQLLNAKDDTENLYLGSGSQSLKLRITNRSKSSITLPVKGSRPIPTSPRLQLLYRTSTLDLSTASVASQPWLLTSGSVSDRIGILKIQSTAEVAPVIAPGDALEITLDQVQPRTGPGERSTRVELVYSDLLAGASTITGNRSQLLLLAAGGGLGPGYPFVAGFVYAPNLVNDGTTENSLIVRIVNTLDSDIPLTGTEEFSFAFDVQEQGKTQPYALIEASQINAIGVQQRIDPDDPTASTSEWSGPTTHPTAPFFPQNPAAGNNSPFQSRSALQFKITGLKTSMPDGVANLYVGFRNFSGLDDGQLTLSVTRSGLAFANTTKNDMTRVGVNQSDPQTALDVVGGITADSISAEKVTATAAQVNGTLSADSVNTTTSNVNGTLAAKNVNTNSGQGTVTMGENGLGQHGFGIGLNQASIGITGSNPGMNFVGLGLTDSNLGMTDGSIYINNGGITVSSEPPPIPTPGQLVSDNVKVNGNVDVYRPGTVITPMLQVGRDDDQDQNPIGSVFTNIQAGTFFITAADFNGHMLDSEYVYADNNPSTTPRGQNHIRYFNRAFSATPMIIATAARTHWNDSGTGAGASDIFNITFENVTPASFQVLARRTDVGAGGGTAFDIQVSWIAFTLL